jgi:hypothetical protein
MKRTPRLITAIGSVATTFVLFAAVLALTELYPPPVVAQQLAAQPAGGQG